MKITLNNLETRPHNYVKEDGVRTSLKKLSTLRCLLMTIAGLALLTCHLGCKPIKVPKKPLSLGQFTEISKVSISPDGTQITFDGCGHKEYPPCTLYRFDRNDNRIYRYLPRTPHESLYGGRYSPSSDLIALSVIPYDQEGKPDYENTQLALMQQDGTGFKVVTESKGLKTAPAISYDENQLAFFKSKMSSAGSPLRKQRTRALGYDLYSLNLLTRKETRLTKYEFYGAGNAYFTSDNKKILFEGDSPLRTPYSEQAADYRKQFKNKYKENIIFSIKADASDINNELTHYFTYSHGSRIPVIFKDGSLVFEGREGIQGFIHHFKRSPDGKLDRLTDEEVGEDGKSVIVVRDMTGTPDGRLLVILNYNQKTNQRYIRVLDLATRKVTDIIPPTIIENITLR